MPAPLPIPEPAGGASPPRGAMMARRSVALASALLLGGTLQAAAQTPDPTAGAVWGGCVLSDAAVTALPAGVDFVVVYSLSNPDDGQALDGGGGHTGPVICINESRVGITAFEFDDITPLTPESRIPDATGPEGAATVNLLAAEEALIVQYRLNPSLAIEKRFCQTFAGNSQCFILFDVAGGGR
jgi:hypothetical protein